MNKQFGDVSVELDNYVAVVEIQRAPHNYFDAELIRNLVEAFQTLDETPDCRASVLCSEGKSFCAGANFNSGPSVLEGQQDDGRNPLYVEAVKLFACKKPIVAAVHGPAIGGGLGLALAADFRVTCAEARFSANFAKVGIHPGFGLTYTLPALVGRQKAARMFYTGCRIYGEDALEWGLADSFTTRDKLRDEAQNLAREIAANAPLAVMSVRATLRQGLIENLQRQTDHEGREQDRLRLTEDFREGVASIAERRPGKFVGR